MLYCVDVVISRRCDLLSFFFFFNDTATTEIYTLSLHDALPISRPPTGPAPPPAWCPAGCPADWYRFSSQPPLPPATPRGPDPYVHEPAAAWPVIPWVVVGHASRSRGRARRPPPLRARRRRRGRRWRPA